MSYSDPYLDYDFNYAPHLLFDLGKMHYISLGLCPYEETSKLN